MWQVTIPQTVVYVVVETMQHKSCLTIFTLCVVNKREIIVKKKFLTILCSRCQSFYSFLPTPMFSHTFVHLYIMMLLWQSFINTRYSPLQIKPGKKRRKKKLSLCNIKIRGIEMLWQIFLTTSWQTHDNNVATP